MRDKHSVAGLWPRVDRRVPVVVVGAGPAGVSAALEAARAGVEVALIDEHPLDHELMAMDVPLYFGQRMSPAARNRALMLERVVEANPSLSAAVEAGVDVQPGVLVWGAFRNGPTQRELPGPVLGLANEARSWLLGYERLVVAAGARDVAMGFPGWEKAGVMGAAGLAVLLARYRAFAGRRLVVLGSGPLGLQTARRALEAGIEVAAVVDVTATPRGDPALVRQLAGQGVRFYPGCVVKAAQGPTGDLEALTLVRVAAGLTPVPGSEFEVACDTVCLALGLTPTVELLDLLGCRLSFRADRGGFVPEVDGTLQTTVPGVFVAGDVAGTHEGLAGDEATACDQGRLAGLAAAASLGAVTAARVEALRQELGHLDLGPAPPVHDYWRTWLRALVQAGGMEVSACQCEEVTRRELVGIEPPRYLGWQSRARSARSLETLLADGPLNQDQVKRLTRAGMGPCQGRRCREQVALLLGEAAGRSVGEIPLPSFRAPVRPLPLRVLWAHDESEETRRDWVSWFGIPTQFTPHWTARVDARDTIAFVGLAGESQLGADPAPAGTPSRLGTTEA